MLQDLRYAFRTLIANPGFTIVAVLCLSLGIGVNGTIFSVVDGVLLQPYPYPDADQIVVLNSANPKQDVSRDGVSYPDFKDWRDGATSFAAMAAFQGRSLTISDGTSEPERYAGAAVSWTLFGLLGNPPALGETLAPRTIAWGRSRSCCCLTMSGGDDMHRIPKWLAARSPSTAGRIRSLGSCRRGSGFLKRSVCGFRWPRLPNRPGGTIAAVRSSPGSSLG